MMVSADDFYEIKMYDKLMPIVCENYYDFLHVGASAVPKDTKSICDIGIGTGMFSMLVRERLPNIEVHGIDINKDLLNFAKTKIKGLKTYELNINTDPFPEVDYFISSMTLHHLDTEKRKEGLLKIINNSNGLINFDLVLDNEYDYNKAIESVVNFTRKTIIDENKLKELEGRLRASDNYMHIEEQKEIFESFGMKFEVLKRVKPYIVYKVSK